MACCQTRSTPVQAMNPLPSPPIAVITVGDRVKQQNLPGNQRARQWASCGLEPPSRDRCIPTLHRAGHDGCPGCSPLDFAPTRRCTTHEERDATGRLSPRLSLKSALTRLPEIPLRNPSLPAEIRIRGGVGSFSRTLTIVPDRFAPSLFPTWTTRRHTVVNSPITLGRTCAPCANTL